MTAPALARKARYGEPGFTTGGRVYEDPVTRQIAVSITSVIAMLDKSALKYWVGNQCAEYAADNLTALSRLSRDEVIKLVKAAPWSKSGTAAEVGDQIHNAIDQFAKTGERPSMDGWSITAKRMWGSFLAFNNRYKPEWLDTEFTVWSNEFGYAGTADWSARIGGALVLGDTKTGKAIYPEVGIQLAAIQNADYIIGPDGTRRDIPRYDRLAALHIRPMSAKLHPIKYGDKCFQAFAALRTLKYWRDVVSDSVVIDAPKITNELVGV